MQTTQIAIVGGGPAGLAAALAAVEAGATVTLIDEQPTLGGHWRWLRTPLMGITPELDGRSGVEAAELLTARLRALDLQVLTETVAWGLFDERTLALAGPQGSFLLQAERLILATGAIDRRVPFPGWTLPGVMTAREALRVRETEPALLGEYVVVIGAGDDADHAVVALEGSVRTVTRLPGWADVAVEGRHRVEQVRYQGHTLPADTVVVALGRLPDATLAQQAGAQLAFDEQLGWWRVHRDESLQTTLPGVFVAGEAGGAQTDAEAWQEGRLAGLVVANAHDLAVLQAEGALRRSVHQQAVDPLSPAWAASLADDLVICRCEMVTAGTIRAAIRDGARSLNDIKRRTRAGMGECQGAWCSPAIACVLAAALGSPRSALVPLTARPPARPIPLAALAALEGVDVHESS